jgi:hypothetical protein
MTLARKLLVVSGVLVVAGALIESQMLAPQRRELAGLQREADRIASALRQQRHEVAGLNRQLAELERTMTNTRAAAVAGEAGSAIRLWASRIALLKRLLGEMPTQWIPELRLLQPVDWVHIVRTRELDTSENIRRAFGAARAAGRQKFSVLLQQAVRRFAEQSGGMLPTEVTELEAYLPPPGDLAMLQRYTVVQTGRLVDAEGPIFREVDTSDFIGEVSLDSLHLANNPMWKVVPGDNDAAAMGRTLAVMETLSASDHDADKSTAAQITTYKTMMDLFRPKVESFFGNAVGPSIKQAAARFAADHGAPPAHMGDLAPYFEEIPLFMNFARPVLAEMEYMAEHDGQRPADPAQLKPYLAKPLNELRLLRNMRLTVDGERVKMDLQFNVR